MTTIADLSTHPDPLVRALAAECAAWRAHDARPYYSTIIPSLLTAACKARDATDVALKEHKS